MSIRYDLPKGQFFDDEGRYVNPGTVADKLREAESEVTILRAIQTYPQGGEIGRLARMVAELEARSEP